MTDQPFVHILPYPDIQYDLSAMLRPSAVKRDYFTTNFYRCLPLTSANTVGWTLHNPFRFKAVWKGGSGRDDVVVTMDETDQHWAHAWFGHGTFTIAPQFLVQTSPGMNLLIRPVPNHWKLPVLFMEGMVETDWLKSSFTLNFRMMLPMIGATFEVGEPLVQIVPFPRELPEAVDARIVTHGAEYDERMTTFTNWALRRKDRLDQPKYEPDHEYMRGIDVDQTRFSEHKRTFHMRPFIGQDDAAPTVTPPEIPLTDLPDDADPIHHSHSQE